MINEKIYLAPECLGQNIELVGVTPDLYLDGVRQPEPIGYRYEVLLRDHRCEKLVVRIPGPQQMDEPLNGTGVRVVFDEIKVRPYVNRATATMAFSASAAKIKPLDKPKA